MQIAILSIIAFVLYTIGFPVLFTTLLFKYRTRAHDRSVRYWLGNLYYCYKEKLFWFELVIIARRLVLAVLLSALSITSLYRFGGVMFILLVALLVQFWAWPFTQRKDNVFEVMSLAVLILTFATQSVLVWQDIVRAS